MENRPINDEITIWLQYVTDKQSCISRILWFIRKERTFYKV